MWKPVPVARAIPAEQEIDNLIAGSPEKLATILQLLKETGSRIGETLQVQWIDLKEKAQTITINSPEKNSYPGIFKVSAKLIGMLNSLPKKSERIFHKANPNTAQLCLSRARKRVAAKLQNQRLLQVNLSHTPTLESNNGIPQNQRYLTRAKPIET